jgi:hypothetical protein
VSNLGDIGDIINRLIILDRYCSEKGVVGEIVLLGGSGILAYMNLFGSQFRATLDIDVNLVSSNNEEEFIKVLQEAKIDVVGGIMEVPPLEDFNPGEGFYELGSEFSAIRVYVPNIELLACCKIFTTRGKDLEDLENSLILEQCDLEKLMKMIDEYTQYLLNPSNSFLNLHELERILNEKGLK